MKNIFLIFITILGIVGFYSCEKEETQAILSENPAAPVITQLSDLVLARANAQNPVVITGTEADFGFDASIKYTLEADLEGNNFADAILLGTASKDTFTFTVNSLNSLLINTLPQGELLAIELRVKAVLVTSSTGSDPISVISETSTVNITTYGPPTLALTDDAHHQGIVSATDNGIYVGWIYTDGTPFTLTNKDNGDVYGYGATDAVVSIDGDPITLEAGAYDMKIDLNTMEFTKTDVTIGIIGDAVGGWDNDTKMIWDFTDKTWNIQKAVVTGGFKFRTHNTWSAVNVAYNPAGHDLNNLYQSLSGADSQNIDNIDPGTYNIKLFLKTTPMKVTITPAK